MKYITYFIFLFSCCISPFKTLGQYNFDIKGYIDNSIEPLAKSDLRNGDHVMLQFLNLSRTDTVFINNDSFNIRGEVPYPSIAMLDYKYGGFLFLIDNSSYQFVLTLKKFDSTKRYYDGVIKTESVFFNTWKNFSKIRGGLNTRKSALQDALKLTSNKDSILFYNTEIKAIDDTLMDNYKKLAADNPDSYITAYMFPEVPDFSYSNYINMYNSFPDSVKNSFYGKNFYSLLMASKILDTSGNSNGNTNLETQNDIPVISGIDTSYKKLIIDKEFYKKHRYTLIEFWASWCVPCRRANEELKKKKEELFDDDVQVIGFSLDKAGEPWRIALSKDKTDWLQISDFKATDSPIAKFLNLTYIPYNILIDSNGKIVKRNIYGKELDDFISQKK